MSNEIEKVFIEVKFIKDCYITELSDCSNFSFLTMKFLRDCILGKGYLGADTLIYEPFSPVLLSSLESVERLKKEVSQVTDDACRITVKKLKSGVVNVSAISIRDFLIPQEKLENKLLNKFGNKNLFLYSWKKDGENVVYNCGDSCIRGVKRGDFLDVSEVKIEGWYSRKVLDKLFTPLLPKTKGLFVASVHHDDPSNDFIIEVIDGVVSRFSIYKDGETNE